MSPDTVGGPFISRENTLKNKHQITVTKKCGNEVFLETVKIFFTTKIYITYYIGIKCIPNRAG
jgi:hypothetical protein